MTNDMLDVVRSRLKFGKVIWLSSAPWPRFHVLDHMTDSIEFAASVAREQKRCPHCGHPIHIYTCDNTE